MHYLAEDPWPLMIAFGIVAGVALIALKVTQRGKFLVVAAVAAALALAVFGIDRIWVTDDERIENVVYALADAVEKRDADAIEALMAPGPRAEVGGTSAGIPMEEIRVRIEDLDLDFLIIDDLEAHASPESRLGTARFRARVGGTYRGPEAKANLFTPTHDSEWDLGFREVEPGVWKITRITPTHLPFGASITLPR